jgi:hypothetical protein
MFTPCSRYRFGPHVALLAWKDRRRLFKVLGFPICSQVVMKPHYVDHAVMAIRIFVYHIVGWSVFRSRRFFFCFQNAIGFSWRCNSRSWDWLLVNLDTFAQYEITCMSNPSAVFSGPVSITPM